MKELVDKLHETRKLEKKEWVQLIQNRNDKLDEYIFEKARNEREQYYGNQVYIRGLIEFTNYCKNDCYYCGIRRSNKRAERYHLTENQILDCCDIGYELGFRTFVLQGGEDRSYTDETLVHIIESMKTLYPDCAVTLSIGERSHESYRAYFDAGADRYLLRHETANANHYRKLHPEELTLEHRMQCLADLKQIGYQTGCGFMVGSPYQTAETLADDMVFIQNFQPHMVGIGPFIPHHQTPFAEKEGGSVELTLTLLGLIRIMIPNILLPATTALGTLHPRGRERGMAAGANVVMPNLSPVDVRKKYLLYDNKICTGDEAAESLQHLKETMKAIGYEVVTSRGDFICKE
ncbi:MAG: [FeFe] hydrogenase H-cluster radical SAM maturase HydE [Clostridiales bacterium]|nr:[FeFe] hydrogenase H-cluster radical SAM maturase HydE [Clostridiales bacterium]